MNNNLPPYGSDKETWLCNERLLTWDIKPNDVVIVIGGYQGHVCNELLKRYPLCVLYTWEPQTIMYNRLVEVLEGRGRAFNYGLGLYTGTFPMISLGNDACSFIYDSNNIPQTTGGMKEFTLEMGHLGIDEISHLHCNIEGYEHFLIPHIINTGWINKIDQLVISTHGLPTNIPNVKSWDWIVEQINKTHIPYWTQRGFYAWSKPNKVMTDLSVLI